MAKKLLLVEDDRAERSLIADAIIDSPDLQADVVMLADGKQALEYLRLNGPSTPGAPAVVFLDLVMPHVNGYEVLREFQKQADANRIPVVVFTASNAEADVYLSYKFGANAFIVKPQEPRRLQSVARRAAAFWLDANVLPPTR